MCLALTIFLEARGEPLAGKYGVGEVILNRVESDLYPDTACEVVAQPHQFATIVYPNVTPREFAVAAFVATDLLLNYEPNTEVLWFYEPSKVDPPWARKLKHAYTIGNHRFMRKP